MSSEARQSSFHTGLEYATNASTHGLYTEDIYTNPRWQQRELGWSSACAYNYHAGHDHSSKRDRRCRGYRSDGSKCLCPCHEEQEEQDHLCSSPKCNYLAHYKLVPTKRTSDKKEKKKKKDKKGKKKKSNKLYYLCRVCYENKSTKAQMKYEELT